MLRSCAPHVGFLRRIHLCLDVVVGRCSPLAVYPPDLLCQSEPIASDLLIRASYVRVAGLRRAAIGGGRSLSVSLISYNLCTHSGRTTGTVASVSRDPSEDRSSGLVSTQAGAFMLAASLAAFIVAAGVNPS
jgi:hypothetical protein